MLDEAHKRRSAAATMLGIFAYKMALSGFGPIFSELLISRACLSLHLPAYPAEGCVQSDDASAIAATRQGYYNLVTSMPALFTVSFYAMLADTRGRQISLTLCYVAALGDVRSTRQRRAELRESFHFVCACARCAADDGPPPKRRRAA